MAGEFNANIIRSRSTDTEPPDFKPDFIAQETEFVGRGVKQSIGKHRRSRSRSGNRLANLPLSLSDENFIEDLEAYVKEMSAARVSGAGMEDCMEPDVWTQLQQKESDLLLAAELGKALLEKNEELKKEQERVTEVYSKKVEVSPFH